MTCKDNRRDQVIDLAAWRRAHDGPAQSSLFHAARAMRIAAEMRSGRFGQRTCDWPRLRDTAS